jgi:hypothetical protein
LIAFCLCSATAIAQSVDRENGKEPLAIIEVGGAVSRSLQDSGSALGPTVAIEVTPIENWLELEAGVTPLFSHGSTEWGTDLLFKKPWTLSPKAEFMIGLGPEWIHTKSANSVSAEAVLDFMCWPSAKHRLGWYIEPSYEYNFGRGRERSIGLNGGLLIAVW